MYIPLPRISEEELADLERQLRQERQALRKQRLHLLVLIGRGEVESVQQAAGRLAVHRNTLGEWLRRYREGGLEGLLEVGQSGAPRGVRHIPASVLADLKARLQERDGLANYGEVQQWLEEKYGLQIPYGTVYRTVRERLHAKLKRPRPRHEKKDEAAEAEFVARFEQRLGTVQAFSALEEEPLPLRVFFQDESRVGLHLPLHRRLTAPGVKPYQPINPVYEYYWLYAAVEPHTGEAYWLEMPGLNTDHFEVFLQHFSQQYPESLNLMLLDGASAHRAQRLVVPDNVLLLFLPPYCPELNPVERLWQDLKGRLEVAQAPVRASLSALRDHVAELIRQYTPQQLASLTGYPYIINAIEAIDAV